MELTWKKKKGLIVWSEKADAVFEEIKWVCIEDVMLHYPVFNEEFEIYIDGSKYQMGGIISRQKRPVAY